MKEKQKSTQKALIYPHKVTDTRLKVFHRWGLSNKQRTENPYDIQTSQVKKESYWTHQNFHQEEFGSSEDKLWLSRTCVTWDSFVLMTSLNAVLWNDSVRLQVGHELASKTSDPHLLASPACQLIRSLTSKLDSSSLAWTRSPSVRCSWWPGTGSGSLAKASWHIQAPFYSESTLRWSIQNASLLLRPHSTRKLVKGGPGSRGTWRDPPSFSPCAHGTRKYQFRTLG